MEILTACLKKKTSNTNFKFHYQTKPLEITHLIFADDVMLFCHEDQISIDLLLQGLSDFSSISGLHANRDKSTCFFSNVDGTTCDFAISKSGFRQGTLPVKYLGLPFITTKLSYRDCNALIMRITLRIDN